MWPATIPAAKRSQSSHAQPNSCTSGARISAASVVRPVTMMRAPAAQRLDDRTRAQVGVGGDHAAADLVVAAPAVHVIETHALRLQLFEARHEIVAGDDADRQRHTRRFADRLDRLARSPRVDPAGVDDHVMPRSAIAGSASFSCSRKS